MLNWFPSLTSLWELSPFLEKIHLISEKLLKCQSKVERLMDVFVTVIWANRQLVPPALCSSTVKKPWRSCCEHVCVPCVVHLMSINCSFLTHPPTKFHLYLFSSFCTIMQTNKQNADRNITSLMNTAKSNSLQKIRSDKCPRFKPFHLLLLWSEELTVNRRHS